jgi:signal transduction histidine kinase
LSNAAKFTRGGRILLTASIEAGVLTVAVEDSGVGIAESEIEGLFETFGNSDQETASNYGDDVRLGLPLAHRYCRLMGGELSVKSKLGLGSRFVLSVPVQPVDQAETATEKQRMERAA